MRSDLISLTIEKPVAGGLMLARHEGRVVLVSGAIPGERVLARPGRVTKQMMWATVDQVVEASPSRRVPFADPACGGLSYAHITYERQLELKAAVLADVFRRVGKITLDAPVPVQASPERAHRMRVRFHVRNRTLGFFRENTHSLCDAGPTMQMRSDALAAASSLISALGDRAELLESVVVSENVEATERVLHLEPRQGARLEQLESLADLPDGVTGVTAHAGPRLVSLAGRPRLSDTAATLGIDETALPAAVTWSRTAASFFQSNRFLVGALLRRVMEHAVGETVLDLYAGVGLFSIGLAGRGVHVTAVEGDADSVGDLELNASRSLTALDVFAMSVEDAVKRLEPARFDAIVADPPRTGLSPEALDGVMRLDAARIVYVSCDPATLARDAAKITSGGYQLSSLEAFDMFPTTAHIEALAVFDRAKAD